MKCAGNVNLKGNFPMIYLFNTRGVCDKHDSNFDSLEWGEDHRKD
jgi:hypothetical protein